jgi:hypothetical protein
MTPASADKGMALQAASARQAITFITLSNLGH